MTDLEPLRRAAGMLTDHRVTLARTGTYTRAWTCTCGRTWDADTPGAAMAAIHHQAAGDPPAGPAPNGSEGAGPTPPHWNGDDDADR